MAVGSKRSSAASSIASTPSLRLCDDTAACFADKERAWLPLDDVVLQTDDDTQDDQATDLCEEGSDGWCNAQADEQARDALTYDVTDPHLLKAIAKYPLFGPKPDYRLACWQRASWLPIKTEDMEAMHRHMDRLKERRALELEMRPSCTPRQSWFRRRLPVLVPCRSRKRPTVIHSRPIPVFESETVGDRRVVPSWAKRRRLDDRPVDSIVLMQ
jgi:hypothetical protein